MRFADRKTYSCEDDVRNLLDQARDASQLSPRAVRGALSRAEKLMYAAVGTEEHVHWINVRNELAKLAELAGTASMPAPDDPFVHPVPQLFYVRVTHKKRTPRSKRWQQRFVVMAPSAENALLHLRALGEMLSDHPSVEEVAIEPFNQSHVALRSVNIP